MAVADDVATSLGVPELAPPAPVAAPVAAPKGPPPLPDEPGLSLITRAALAEGDHDNPDSWRGVAGAVLKRMQMTGKTAAQVLAEPGQFESYQNGSLQSVDPTSPAFRAAQDAIKDVTPGPYDSFYSPSIVAARGHGTPPFDPSTGTKIGTQLFGNGYRGTPGIGANDVANSIGLTDEERQAFVAEHTAPPASTPAGQAPDKEGAFTVGPDAQPMTKAQADWFKANTPPEGWSNVPTEGKMPPFALQKGGPLPLTPGARYVDLDGKEHVVPGGLLEMAAGGLRGLAQGLVMDTAASASRLSEGGAAVDNPLYAAIAQGQGGPSALETGQAAKQGFAQQGAAYALQNSGNLFAQTGRFFGQAIPATVAAMAVPELEAPAALGGAGRVAAGAATNALRGVAAVAPSVAANPGSVPSQLAGGALAGVVAPVALGAPAKAFSALTGLGRKVTPEVATLADTAQSKYGLNLASAQVAGASGDQNAKVAFSEMLKTDPGAQALNRQQRQDWMRGVTSTYGDASGDVSPPALKANQERIGGNIGAVADRVGAIDARAAKERLASVVENAGQDPGFDGNANLTRLVDTISKGIGPDGTMSGAAYKQATAYNSPLMIAVRAGKSPYPAQIKEALDDALEASAAPQDVAELRNSRWQYKNVMTVAKAAQNQNNVGVDGVFTPAALNTATTSNFKNRAFQGAGDLDELNAIRRHFMTEPADSGTPARMKDMLKNFIPGAEAAGVTALGSTLLHRPETIPATAASALVGTGAKIVGDALKRNKVLGSASGIVQRSLPSGAPRPIGSALSGLGKLTRPVEIPLSALAGVRGLGALTPAPSVNAP